MKLSTDVKEFKTKGIDGSLQYVVASSPHMMEILSNSLYSNKIQAIIRELSTNAFESHHRAGHSKAFDVSLPTYSEPKFRIRDYGTGLTLTELKDLYRIYGVSDKGDSNEYTGCFGLGSKSPFAYTDSFTTISYYQGTKHIIENTKDESGCPTLVLMGSYDTDEPDGVEIFFDVEDDDYWDFENEAAKIYQWFKVRPNIDSEFDYEEYNYDLENDNWKFSAGSSEDELIMGQVRYPIENMDAHCIRHGTLTIFANIGDVDISASREKLQYTKKTEAYIKNVYLEVETYINQLISDELCSCKNLYEARLLCWELNKGKYRNFNCSNNISYPGTVDCNQRVELDTPILESVRRYCSPIKKLRETKIVYVQEKQVYVIKDVKTGHIADAKHLGKKYESVFVIEPSNVKEFCDKMGFDGSYLIKSSEVDRPKSMNVKGQTIISTAYEVDFKAYRYGWCRNYRNNWSSVTVNLNKETGVYIPILRWVPCGYTFDAIKDFLSGLPDVDKPTKLIGVLTMRKGKFARHDNWESISEFIARIKSKYEKHFKDFKNHDVRNHIEYLTAIAEKSPQLNKLLPKKANLDLTTLATCDRLHGLKQLGYETDEIAKAIEKKVFAKYPLLQHLEDAPNSVIKEIVLYINAKG